MSNPEQAPCSLVYPPEWDAMTANEQMLWFLARLSAQLDSIRSEFTAAARGDPVVATSHADPVAFPADYAEPTIHHRPSLIVTDHASVVPAPEVSTHTGKYASTPDRTLTCAHDPPSLGHPRESATKESAATPDDTIAVLMAPSTPSAVSLKLASPAVCDADHGVVILNVNVSVPPLILLAAYPAELVPPMVFSTFSLQPDVILQSGTLMHVRRSAECLFHNDCWVQPMLALGNRPLTWAPPNAVYLDPAGHLSRLPPSPEKINPQPSPIHVQMADDVVVLLRGYVWWPPDHQPRMKIKLPEWHLPTQLQTLFVTSVELQPWPSGQLTFLVSACCSEMISASAHAGTNSRDCTIESAPHNSFEQLQRRVAWILSFVRKSTDRRPCLMHKFQFLLPPDTPRAVQVWSELPIVEFCEHQFIIYAHISELAIRFCLEKLWSTRDWSHLVLVCAAVWGIPIKEKMLGTVQIMSISVLWQFWRQEEFKGSGRCRPEHLFGVPRAEIQLDVLISLEYCCFKFRLDWKLLVRQPVRERTSEKTITTRLKSFAAAIHVYGTVFSGHESMRKPMLSLRRVVHIVAENKNLLLAPLRDKINQQPWPSSIQVQIAVNIAIKVFGIHASDDSSSIWWSPDHHPTMESTLQQYLQNTQLHVFLESSVEQVRQLAGCFGLNLWSIIDLAYKGLERRKNYEHQVLDLEYAVIGGIPLSDKLQGILHIMSVHWKFLSQEEFQGSGHASIMFHISSTRGRCSNPLGNDIRILPGQLLCWWSLRQYNEDSCFTKQPLHEGVVVWLLYQVHSDDKKNEHYNATEDQLSHDDRSMFQGMMYPMKKREVMDPLMQIRSMQAAMVLMESKLIKRWQWCLKLTLSSFLKVPRLEQATSIPLRLFQMKQATYRRLMKILKNGANENQGDDASSNTSDAYGHSNSESVIEIGSEPEGARTSSGTTSGYAEKGNFVEYNLQPSMVMMAELTGKGARGMGGMVPSTCYNQGHFQEEMGFIIVTTVFPQGSVDQEYYLGFDHGGADNGFALDTFFIGVPISHNYCSYLIEVHPGFGYHRDYNQVKHHQQQWDPGGSGCCRLGVKPNFKKGGMSGALS